MSSVNIVLNSRILIGRWHHEADRVARCWNPERPKKIEWMQSPSDLCVLSVSDQDDEGQGDPYGRVVERASLPLASRLEETLRQQLGLAMER